jgi:hypothetical protein
MACYGAGGGHGSWTCGSSADQCTEEGGVASYDEGYISSYSGCCMCESGCGSVEPETGTACSYPPASPRPASGLPLGALIGIIVGAVVVVGGLGFVVMKKMKKPADAKGAPDNATTEA